MPFYSYQNMLLNVPLFMINKNLFYDKKKVNDKNKRCK